MPRSLPLLLALALAVAACGEPATEDPDADQAPDEPAGEVGEGVTAVSTIFAGAATIEEVAPGADLNYLAARGQDPHDLELSPGDRADLAEADVIVYAGDIDFQPQVEDAVAEAAGAVVSLAEVAGEDRLLPHPEGHDDDHAHDDDDHAHDDDDDHAHDDDDDHAHGDEDPHVWLDAAIMADAAEAVGDAFAEADPDNADAYRDNAANLADELTALDEDADALLGGDCEHPTVIVSHEAYQYLLDGSAVSQEGISEAGGHGEASPQRLAELTDRIEDADIPAVLAEPVEGRDDAEALAAETGVELLEINPLEIVTGDEFERSYPELLRDQIETFAEAAGCTETGA